MNTVHFLYPEGWLIVTSWNWRDPRKCDFSISTVGGEGEGLLRPNWGPNLGLTKVHNVEAEGVWGCCKQEPDILQIGDASQTKRSEVFVLTWPSIIWDSSYHFCVLCEILFSLMNSTASPLGFKFLVHGTWSLILTRISCYTSFVLKKRSCMHCGHR